ncbi:MAG: ABC transporter substrate-binding protein [Prolixibacteraceae bacterium]|nr:ABC transporter substrate-binding protein [Prolixibacteraceae bacterium]
MKRLVIILVLLFSFILNCTTLKAGITESSVQKVKLQLKWMHQFEFAGYYAAIEKGYYKEAGIDLELLLPDSLLNSIESVNSGKADFGIAGSNILLARAQNKKNVVLASIFQHSPFAIIAPQESGIKEASQLKGKTIALESDSVEIIAFLNKSMIFPKPQEIVPLEFDAVQLLNKKTDAISAYITDEPFMLDSIGFKYNILEPRKNGIDFYGDVLFTSEQLINANPELVENFRLASLKGWHYAMDHPYEIIFLIYNKYSQRHSVKHLEYEMKKMIDLIQEEMLEIGYSNPKRWQKIQLAYQSIGLISSDFKIDGLLYKNPNHPYFFPWKLSATFLLILSLISLLTYFFYQNSKSLKKEIKQREKIQSELALSEELYRSILNASPDTITITDLEGNIEFVSPQAKKLFDYNTDEILHQPLLKYIHPADHQRAMKNIHLMFAGNFTGAAEYKGIKSDGQTFYIEVNAEFIRNINGSPEKMIFVTRDVSDRKAAEEKLQQNEERFRQIVEQSQTIIWEVDAEGLLTYISPVVKSEWGYSPEELVGKLHFYDLHPIENQEKFKNAALSVFENKKPFSKLENPIISKNGETVWVETNGVPILDENQNLLGYRGSDNDITVRRKAEMEIREWNTNLEAKVAERTSLLIYSNKKLLNEIEERKRAENEMQIAKNEAEQANLAKSEFLSRMSHELRTPMNSILGFAQLLEMSELNKSQQKGVQLIMKGGKHLLHLINEVLDITKIEAGGLSLSVEPVQTGPVIAEIIESIRPQASQKQVTVSLKDSPTNRLFISSDQQRLKQILINLIDNAVKYNKVGGSVLVETELVSSQDDNSKHIRISVTDTGRGIHPDDTSKLFQPFERIGAEITGAEGSGLGLTVVKKLITAMNGRIGIESTPNEGSRFWIDLPQIEGQMETAGLRYDSLHSEAEVVKGTILYIEDNQPNIDLIEQILTYQRSNIKLVTTMHGMETLKLAIEFKPNLILLDLNLPDIHGSEVIQQLKENPLTKAVPVVIVSADAMPSQLENLKRLGAVQYLTKPLDVLAFLNVIDQFTSESQEIESINKR